MNRYIYGQALYFMLICAFAMGIVLITAVYIGEYRRSVKITALIVWIFTLAATFSIGVAESRPHYRESVVKNIFMDNLDNDNEIAKSITEHLNRENKAYFFDNAELEKSIETDSKFEEKTNSSYKISWLVLESKDNKKIGSYQIEVRVILDNYKYADQELEFHIEDSAPKF